MNMSIAKLRGTTALAAAVSCVFGLVVVDCAFAQMGGGMCGMGARMGGRFRWWGWRGDVVIRVNRLLLHTCLLGGSSGVRAFALWWWAAAETPLVV